jgi:DNA-binding response OmpR family regulator
MVLRLWGHEVRVVYDGISALAMARNFKPQAALLDILMPKVNGGDVALNLRERSDSETPLLIATSANDPDDPRLVRYEGALDAFLNKPCDLEHLAELLAYRHSPAAVRREPMHVSG